MKLSKESIGFRFTKTNWHRDKFLDVSYVGRFWIRGTDQNGNKEEFQIDDMDVDWIMLGEAAIPKEFEI